MAGEVTEKTEGEVLTRDSKYVQDLKVENTTLRKIILDKEREEKELKEDMAFLLEVVKLAGKEACEILNIEATPENIEDYVDELCSQLEEGKNAKTN